MIATDDGPKQKPDDDLVRKLSVSISQSAPSSRDQSLVIYFRPKELRTRFKMCDSGIDLDQSQSQNKSSDARAVEEIANRLWIRVQTILGERKNPILLNVKSDTKLGTGSGASTNIPLLRTRSALGVMKNGAEGDNLVFFGSPDDVDKIIQATYDATTPIGDRNSSRLKNHCNSFFYKTGNDGLSYTNTRFIQAPSNSEVTGSLFDAERNASVERRLVLIQVTKQKPEDAFSPTFHEGVWYSLQNRDLISKQNLQLFSEINTIQAIPSQSPPMTPTISVGAK